MALENINPFDILSGKVAILEKGIYYFKEAGNNIRPDGTAIRENIHRDNGPAFIGNDGTIRWYKNGMNHREGGPATVLENGTIVWVINNKIHREDGPAMVLKNGDVAYYLHNRAYSEKDFRKIVCKMKKKK